MQQKVYQFSAIFAIVLAMSLLLSGLTAQATTAPPDGASGVQRAAPTYTYTRILTVTTPPMTAATGRLSWHQSWRRERASP